MNQFSWQEHIPGTMGSIDKDFARHSGDRERAFDLLTLLREENVGMSEVEDAYRTHFSTHGCTTRHIDEQLKRIRRYFEPWLRD